MSALLNDLFVLLLAISSGAVIGYLYRARLTPEPEAPSCPPAEPASKPSVSDESREFLLSVQSLTQKVAARVGDHSKQVQQLNSELLESGCDVASVLAKLIHANERMAEQLNDAESKLKNQAMMIDLHITEARTDALTGLANRRAFNDEMRNQLLQFEQHATPASVLMVDIDYFKKLNDVHGHLVGDDVLVSVAKAITQHIRSEDLAARYGGEEFAVIFPRTTAKQARMIAERIRESISRSVCQISDKPIRITASGGLSQLMPKDSTRTWLHRADEALYYSKDSGRDCGHWNDGGTFKPFIELTRQVPPVSRTRSSESSKVVEFPDLAASENEELLDPVTQLLSTEAFNKYFARALSESRRTGIAMSLITIRVDRFHEITERYGTATDGLILRMIGRLLHSSVRSSDHVARYGNDSMAILLPKANLSSAVRVAKRLRAAVELLTIKLTEEAIHFTISIGVGEERGNDGTAPLIDRVTRAVAIASSRGGDQTVISDGEMFDRVKFDGPSELSIAGGTATGETPSSNLRINPIFLSSANTTVIHSDTSNS